MTLFVVASVLVLGGLVVLSHSRFSADLAVIDRAWTDLRDDLSERHALVPRLVETVRGRLRRVDGTLEDVVVARSRAIQSARQTTDRVGRRAEAENELTTALSRMLSLRVDAGPVRDDPELAHLVDRLDFLHQRIAADRQVYNLAVQGHNRRVDTAPSRLVAALFGIRTRDYFTLADPGALSVGVDGGAADPPRQ